MPGARVWLVVARKQPWRCKIADKQRTAKQLLPGRYWISVLGSSGRINALQPGLENSKSVLITQDYFTDHCLENNWLFPQFCLRLVGTEEWLMSLFAHCVCEDETPQGLGSACLDLTFLRALYTLDLGQERMLLHSGLFMIHGNVTEKAPLDCSKCKIYLLALSVIL